MELYCLSCGEWVSVADTADPCPECDHRMGGLEDVRDRLPPYEIEAARDVLDWMNRPPGAVATAVNKVIDGVIGGTKTVVPDKVADEVSRSLATLLEFLQELSFYAVVSDEAQLREELEKRFGKGKAAEVLAKVIPLVSGKGIIQQAAELGHEANEIEDLRKLDLSETDRLAGCYMSLIGNRGVAVAEGAVTGLGGLPLLIVDVPAVTAINFRYVQQIASCFGYDQDREQEKIFAMRVFTLAFGAELGGSDPDRETGMTAKTAAAYELKSLAYAAEHNWSRAQMAQKAVLLAVLSWLKARAPRQLAKHVIKRKAAAAVPILGSGISAGLNYTITKYTGKVAWYCYRYRKLLETFGGLGSGEMPPAPLLPNRENDGESGSEDTTDPAGDARSSE